MALQETQIVAGKTYTSKRWKGDRKVVALLRGQGRVIVHFVDLRTMRTGNAPLARFATSSDGPGLVSSL